MPIYYTSSIETAERHTGAILNKCKFMFKRKYNNYLRIAVFIKSKKIGFLTICTAKSFLEIIIDKYNLSKFLLSLQSL